jgi:hypothetical protein
MVRRPDFVKLSTLSVNINPQFWKYHLWGFKDFQLGKKKNVNMVGLWGGIKKKLEKILIFNWFC